MIFLFGQPTLFAPVWDELLQQCLRTHPGARVSICFRTQCFLGEQLLLAARYFCADLSYCVPTEGFEDLARAAILRVCNSRAPALFVSYDRQLNQSCIDNGWLDGIADIDSPPDELLLVTSAGGGTEARFVAAKNPDAGPGASTGTLYAAPSQLHGATADLLQTRSSVPSLDELDICPTALSATSSTSVEFAPATGFFISYGSRGLHPVFRGAALTRLDVRRYRKARRRIRDDDQVLRVSGRSRTSQDLVCRYLLHLDDAISQASQSFSPSVLDQRGALLITGRQLAENAGAIFSSAICSRLRVGNHAASILARLLDRHLAHERP